MYRHNSELFQEYILIKYQHWYEEDKEKKKNTPDKLSNVDETNSG